MCPKKKSRNSELRPEYVDKMKEIEKEKIITVGTTDDFEKRYQCSPGIEFYALFVSYRHGDHCMSISDTTEGILVIMKQVADDIEGDDEHHGEVPDSEVKRTEFPTADELRESLMFGEMFIELKDSEAAPTWMTVQRFAGFEVQPLIDGWRSRGELE